VLPRFSCYSSGNPWLKGGSPRVITNNPLKADTINPSEMPQTLVGKRAGGLKSQREWCLVRVYTARQQVKFFLLFSS